MLCDPAILPENAFESCENLTAAYAAPDATGEQLLQLGALLGRPWYLPAARAGEAMPAVQAMPYDPLPGGDFWYDAEYARLDQYNGYEVNLILPRAIDGVALSMLGGNALSRAISGDNFDIELPVRSVVVPETYKELVWGGLENCETLGTFVCYAPV